MSSINWKEEKQDELLQEAINDEAYSIYLDECEELMEVLG